MYFSIGFDWYYINLDIVHEEQEEGLVRGFWLNGQNLLKAHSNVWDNFRPLKAFKNDEKCFLFHLNTHIAQYLTK